MQTEDTPPGGLSLPGELAGSLSLPGELAGGLSLLGELAGSLSLPGELAGSWLVDCGVGRQALLDGSDTSLASWVLD